MGSTKRRWVWLAIVALVAAIWWLVPRPTSPSPPPASSKVEVPEPEPPPRPRSTSAEPRRSDDEEPIAVPLPRHEVELPSTAPPMDGGVQDPVPIEQTRDEMIGTVLDRLEDELRAAEEAGNEEETARLKIRIERLSQRRDELADP